jgi:hypothetical protein
MHAREAVEVRGRIAAASQEATHAGLLRVLQTQELRKEWQPTLPMIRTTRSVVWLRAHDRANTSFERERSNEIKR